MRIVYWVHEDKYHLPTRVSLTPEEAVKRHKNDSRIKDAKLTDEMILEDFIITKQAKVE